jgi:transposase-like protein
MGDTTRRGRPRKKKTPKCPHCKQSNTVAFGLDKNKRQRYKCISCSRTFNERAGTAFYRARKSEKRKAQSSS